MEADRDENDIDHPENQPAEALPNTLADMLPLEEENGLATCCRAVVMEWHLIFIVLLSALTISYLAITLSIWIFPGKSTPACTSSMRLSWIPSLIGGVLLAISSSVMAVRIRYPDFSRRTRLIIQAVAFALLAVIQIIYSFIPVWSSLLIPVHASCETSAQGRYMASWLVLTQVLHGIGLSFLLVFCLAFAIQWRWHVYKSRLAPQPKPLGPPTDLSEVYMRDL